MHPSWPETLQRDCKFAGVPFFFKQWGTWGTVYEKMGTQHIKTFRFYNSYLHFRQKDWVNKGDILIDMEGRICKIGADMQTACYPVAIMQAIGKKKAGNMLSGNKTYLELPQNQLP